MAKYFYDKYYSTLVTMYNNNLDINNLNWRDTNIRLDSLYDGIYRNCSFDKRGNSYAFLNRVPVSTNLYKDDIVYFDSRGAGLLTLYKPTFTIVTSGTATVKMAEYPLSDNSTYTERERGTMYQAGVIAEDGTYPADGLHTDNFWYIRRGLANTAPTTPGTFTQPTGTLETGDTKAVSWGASSDAQGNLSKYILEASINNGGYTVIAQPTTPTFSYVVPTATSVKFRVKAVDTAGLESAYRESALLTVTKPMHYWSKYHRKTEDLWLDTAPWEPQSNERVMFYGKDKAYNFNGITRDYGQLIGVNWNTTDTIPEGSTAYTVEDAGLHPSTYTIVTRYVNQYAGYNTSDILCTVHKKFSTNNTKTIVEKQGALIQSGITAIDGAYPTNGVHTDGYWYVRGGRVSLSIAPPSAFTVPATGSTLLPKQALTLAFGASTAPALSTYEVQSRYNGGAWVDVGTHTNALTRAFTVTTDKLLTTVEYRVRAKNTSNVYSDYIHSEVFAIQHNAAPTMTLSTTDSRTLYESDNYGIIGTATDTDSGDVINVMYQINGGEKRAILAHISTGGAIPFNLTLTFKGGMLYNGVVAVTPVLSEGGQHTLRVWAEDNQGGTPAEQTRVFYVVPNRPASLTINPFSSATDLINTDAMTVSGSVSDPDNNTVTVKYKIANGSYTEIYSGSGGSFSFQLLLSTLAIGVNTITIQATDNYGAVTSKTLQVTKAENTQPLKTAVTRYKMTPPNGTAKGVLLWIEREVGDLVVDAEISMGMAGEAENFVTMTKKGTALVTDGIEEDEFLFEADSAKENIVLKLTMTRSSTASEKGITLISGVLS